MTTSLANAPPAPGAVDSGFGSSSSPIPFAVVSPSRVSCGKISASTFDTRRAISPASRADSAGDNVLLSLLSVPTTGSVPSRPRAGGVSPSPLSLTHSPDRALCSEVQASAGAHSNASPPKVPLLPGTTGGRERSGRERPRPRPAAWRFPSIATWAWWKRAFSAPRS